MWFGIISLFPDMFRAITEFGITRRAVEKNIITLSYWNPRDFSDNACRTVDARPYGGGPGMIMQFQPIYDAILAAKHSAEIEAKILGQHALLKPLVIYLSPQGRQLTHQHVKALSKKTHLILVTGRYEGIDERLIQSVIDEEWSVGDYVLSGGELPAMMMIDSIARLLPGTLGHSQSAVSDSFSDELLDHPQYTRPVINQIGGKVPDVLVSGDHEQIRQWRLKQSLGQTWLKRPDLLEKRIQNAEENKLLTDFMKENQVP
ncbi:MAG: tRNA (guanosine(37)-N1)-methyltransferase TrmD [Endozoicomonadaceae bacterium]|nr:tRNA (guanosine(37)-N1)-methyltransferase TrmD [Endozoicomonadaceae bacterium]MBE8233113.1 tRNA (guanosine(37)-N1)-methyltransferase TrmD [Endozoicomonadaceae bacterium]